MGVRDKVRAALAKDWPVSSSVSSSMERFEAAVDRMTRLVERSVACFESDGRVLSLSLKFDEFELAQHRERSDDVILQRVSDALDQARQEVGLSPAPPDTH